MKEMLQGTDAIDGLGWVLSHHLASFISLIVLLPISTDYKLAARLVADRYFALVFAALTSLIVRKTQTLQSSVEGHYSDLAERASDTLGNIALVQSFARLDQKSRVAPGSLAACSRADAGSVVVGPRRGVDANSNDFDSPRHHRPRHVPAYPG